MAEREQEREEYESKIEELKDLIQRKASKYLEDEDDLFKKVKFLKQKIIPKKRKNIFYRLIHPRRLKNKNK